MRGKEGGRARGLTTGRRERTNKMNWDPARNGEFSARGGVLCVERNSPMDVHSGSPRAPLLHLGQAIEAKSSSL